MVRGDKLLKKYIKILKKGNNCKKIKKEKRWLDTLLMN